MQSKPRKKTTKKKTTKAKRQNTKGKTQTKKDIYGNEHEVEYRERQKNKKENHTFTVAFVCIMISAGIIALIYGNLQNVLSEDALVKPINLNLFIFITFAAIGIIPLCIDFLRSKSKIDKR